MTPSPQLSEGAPAPTAGPAGGGLAAISQPAEEGDVSTPGGEPPTPELQAAYETVVVEAVENLDRRAESAMRAVMSEEGDKAEAAGRLSASLAFAVDESKGGRVPDKAVIAASAEIGEQLAERLKLAGLPIDNAFLQRSTDYMMVALGDMYGVTQEELEQLMASVPENQREAFRSQQMSFFDEQAPEAQPASPAAQPAAAQPAALPNSLRAV